MDEDGEGRQVFIKTPKIRIFKVSLENEAEVKNMEHLINEFFKTHQSLAMKSNTYITTSGENMLILSVLYK